jgi:iron complex outermembrane receptor protein
MAMKNERWKDHFSFNANNLLNRCYFSGASGHFAVYPGSPRDPVASFQLIRCSLNPCSQWKGNKPMP